MARVLITVCGDPKGWVSIEAIDTTEAYQKAEFLFRLKDMRRRQYGFTVAVNGIPANFGWELADGDAVAIAPAAYCD